MPIRVKLLTLEKQRCNFDDDDIVGDV
jgi:hypothetical protein